MLLAPARKHKKAAVLLGVLAIVFTALACGNSDFDRWIALESQASELAAEGRYATAAPLAQEAADLAEELFGPESPSLAASLTNLALILTNLDHLDRAEDFYFRAFSIAESNFEPGHALFATTRNNLARFYKGQARYQAAQPLYKNALSDAEGIFGADHPNILPDLFNLAEVLLLQGEFRSAEDLLFRALDLQENAAGPDNPDSAATLNKLEELYRTARMSDDAESIQLQGLNVVETRLAPGDANASTMRFTDVTQEAGITYQHVPQVPVLGMLESADMTGGAVAEDFNGDGWIDLFVLRGGAAPSLLYINQRDGTFTDEAQAWGAALPTVVGAAAGAADFDNDGDIDLVVVGQSLPHYLLINDGAGHFTVDSTMITHPKVFATSPSWGDVDNDGLLELAIGEWRTDRAEPYVSPPGVKDTPATFVDEFTPLFMYYNTGQGRLEIYEFRITPQIDNWVFSPRFADLNGDRLTDLVVVADFGSSRVYLNVGDGMFEAASAASDNLSDENGMGSAIGDYDNDGDLDWFISSIFDNSNPEQKSHGVTGNRLYRNDGGMVFSDVTGAAGVRDGAWGWGASFGDLDNDGDLDLYHVNGWIQLAQAGNPILFDTQPARLFKNLGNGTFKEEAEVAGAGNTGQGRGVILFDFDNDGDLDIFITNNHEFVFDGTTGTRRPGTPALLRNDTQNGNHWLKVTLEGKTPLHGDGIGSRVYVTVGGLTQMRELHASTNYLSQEPGRIAHFGVGTATVIDEVRAEWVNGEVSILTDVAVDQTISISSR